MCDKKSLYFASLNRATHTQLTASLLITVDGLQSAVFGRPGLAEQHEVSGMVFEQRTLLRITHRTTHKEYRKRRHMSVQECTHEDTIKSIVTVSSFVKLIVRLINRYRV